MKSIGRFDQNLPAALADLAQPTVPDYIDDVLQLTARTSQRPAWRFPERWLPMTALAQRLRLAPVGSLRPVALLLLIGLLLAAAAVAFIGSRTTAPPPFGLAANGGVAFGSGGDVWLADSASGTARVLVGGTSVDHMPVWSLDGTRLAFIRNGDTLVVVNADGSGLVELTEDPLREPNLPIWAPDGSTIAIEHESRGVRVVSIARLDGTRRLSTLNLGIQVEQPAWRPPDGRELLMRGVTPAGEPNLYITNADGTGLRSLGLPSAGIDPSLEFHGGSWSPDGTRILYGGLEFVGSDGIGRFRSHVVSADGSGDRMIAAPADLSDVWPRWSPDARHFLVERVQGDYLTDDHETSLVIADADGPGVVEVSDLVDPEGFGAVWSPDGTRILARATSSNRLYLIDATTGEATEQPWSTDHDAAWQRR